MNAGTFKGFMFPPWLTLTSSYIT